jgi:heat shock gene repressor HrcA
VLINSQTSVRKGRGRLDLDERKLKILQAIIRNYLETGEPVGSRTISKYTDLNLSSATIRNEMSDLEELGYILQPHTSAGRIPSDKGYRLYVDHMMLEKEEQLNQATQEVKELQKLLLEREDKMESVLKQMAKMLAANTNYATMISAPQVKGNKLKFIQLSRVEKCQLLTTIVVEGNVIKNSMIVVDDPLDDETLLKLNILLNTNLNGLPIEEINLAMIAKLKQQAGDCANIVAEVMDAVASQIKNDENVEIYTSGANNIFKYPELADNQRASELITTFEEKQLLTELVNETLTDETGTGIQVYIGNETPVRTMKDCSVVTATYELEEGVKGTIGIIGPRRMDYDKVIHTLKTLKSQLDTIYKKDDGQT